MNNRGVLKLLIGFVLLLLQLMPTVAAAQADHAEETMVTDVYQKAKVPAYLVAEYPSGRIISGKNINTQLPIASLTKLVTAYTARQEGVDFFGTTTFQWSKFNTGRIPKNAFRFSEKEAVNNRDVLDLMLIVSNNSASRMLASATNLSEKVFVERMNQYVKELGINDTTLADTSGLDDGNVSTAHDLLTIFMANLEDPQLLYALGRQVYSFKTTVGRRAIAHTIHSSNLIPKLYKQRKYDIVASKTGFTGKVSTLAMLVESRINKNQYVIITLGNPNYTQRFLEPHKIAQYICAQK